MRSLLRMKVVSLSLLLLCGGMLHAAEGPDLIPQSASMVIRLQAPKTALKEASAFVNDVQQGYGQLVAGQAGMLGVGISNPTMQGVDQGRDWYAAVFLSADEEPAVVFFIPALSVDEMKDAIDESFFFTSKDDIGIYSESEEAIDAVQAHLDDRTSESIGSVASEQIKQMMMASHISVAVNLVSVKETYSAELAEAREEMMEGIREGLEEAPEVPGVKLDWLPALMEGLADKVTIAVEDAQAYVVALTLAQSGVRLEEYLEFADSSRSAAFLAKYPAGDVKVMSKLPARQLGYGSVSKSLGKLTAWGMSLVPKIVELEEEQAAEWEKAEKSLAQIDFGASAQSFALGNLDSGLIRAVAVAQVSPADKFRSTLENVSAAMNGVEFPGMTQEMEYTKDHAEIDGTPVDLIVTRQQMDEGEQFGGLQEQINQVMYGGDGMEARVAFLDGAYIQTVGGGDDYMKDAIAAYNSGTADTDAVFTRDMKPLGEENNFVGLFDLQTLIVEGLKIAVNAPNLPPMPFDQEALEDLNVKRAYIGVSAKTTGNGCSGMLHIPKQTLQAGMEMFVFFQQMQMQQQQNAF